MIIIITIIIEKVLSKKTLLYFLLDNYTCYYPNMKKTLSSKIYWGRWMLQIPPEFSILASLHSPFLLQLPAPQSNKNHSMCSGYSKEIIDTVPLEQSYQTCTNANRRAKVGQAPPLASFLYPRQAPPHKSGQVVQTCLELAVSKENSKRGRDFILSVHFMRLSPTTIKALAEISPFTAVPLEAHSGSQVCSLALRLAPTLLLLHID